MTINSIMHHQNSPSSSTAAIKLTPTINNVNHSSSHITTHSSPLLSPKPQNSSSSTFNLNSSSLPFSPCLKRKLLQNNNFSTNQMLNLLPQNEGDKFLSKCFEPATQMSPSNKNLLDDENDIFKLQKDFCQNNQTSNALTNDDLKKFTENSLSNLNGTKIEGVENFLKAQKTFQKLVSQIPGFNLQNPFHLSTISPFLVAALQQHNNFQEYLLNNINTNDNEIRNENINNENNEIDYINNVDGMINSIMNDQANSKDNCNNNIQQRSTASSVQSRTSGIDQIFSGDEDEENFYKRISEPEDLTFGKDRKFEIDGSACSAAGPGNWSYEEQFKQVRQLYELSNDPRRKEWLDDWLGFMHKIGKPVTRIPIMAKQVLDLYELYHLVVQHGGLVEIINKKLWREITKGLSLPSSITSAAFTLRTQYQKYLYDYECEHENLSSLNDLQAAIEGNRREGRRTNPSDSTSTSSSYIGNNLINNGGITPHIHHLNSRLSVNDNLERINNDASAMMTAAAGFPYLFNMSLSTPAMSSFFDRNAFNAKEGKIDFNSISNQQNNMAQRQFEFFQKAALNAAITASGSNVSKNLINNENSDQKSPRDSTSPLSNSDNNCCENKAKKKKLDLSTKNLSNKLTNENKNNSNFANIKITSVEEKNANGQMVVSIELNGVMYSGILFATKSSASNQSKLIDNENLSLLPNDAIIKEFSKFFEKINWNGDTKINNDKEKCENNSTQLQQQNLEATINENYHATEQDNCDENEFKNDLLKDKNSYSKEP